MPYIPHWRVSVFKEGNLRIPFARFQETIDIFILQISQEGNCGRSFDKSLVFWVSLMKTDPDKPRGYAQQSSHKNHWLCSCSRIILPNWNKSLFVTETRFLLQNITSNCFRVGVVYF